MKRNIFKLLSCLFVVTLLTGCAGKDSSTDTTTEKVTPTLSVEAAVPTEIAVPTEAAVVTEAATPTVTETTIPKTEIYVFIAASLSNSMAEVAQKYNEKQPNVKIIYNADSSGTLQTQIEEGAECDIFFSAAAKQMNALKDKGLVEESSITNLLGNEVVLIKPVGGKTTVTGFDNIFEAKNLALAAESVPVGDYARQIFKKLGIWEKVQAMEINEGSNVTAVLSAISEGSNEVGVVYQTDAESVKDLVEVIATAPKDSLDSPVVYPAGLVINKEADDVQKQAAKDFLKYLSSDEALTIFESYGFTVSK